MRDKLDPRGLRYGGNFILCYPLSKIALLVHNEGLGQFVSLSSAAGIIANYISIVRTTIDKMHYRCKHLQCRTNLVEVCRVLSRILPKSLFW